MKNEAKMHEYKNCTIIKLKNRRVVVRKNPLHEEGLIIEFISLVDKDGVLPSICNNVYGGKVNTCGVSISKEAAIALFHCIKNEINRTP